MYLPLSQDFYLDTHPFLMIVHTHTRTHPFIGSWFTCRGAPTDENETSALREIAPQHGSGDRSFMGRRELGTRGPSVPVGRRALLGPACPRSPCEDSGSVPFSLGSWAFAEGRCCPCCALGGLHETPGVVSVTFTKAWEPAAPASGLALCRVRSGAGARSRGWERGSSTPGRLHKGLQGVVSFHLCVRCAGPHCPTGP